MPKTTTTARAIMVACSAPSVIVEYLLSFSEKR